MSVIGFASINLQGRLTADPELKTLEGGRSMCKFTVAVNRRIPGGKEKASFIPVTVFGQEAVNSAEYLTQGRVVYVAGEFETDKYTDRDGNTRTGFGVVASRVTFGSGGRSDEDGPEDNRGPQGNREKRSYGREDSREGDAYRRTRKYLRNDRGR